MRRIWSNVQKCVDASNTIILLYHPHFAQQKLYIHFILKNKQYDLNESIPHKIYRVLNKIEFFSIFNFYMGRIENNLSHSNEYSLWDCDIKKDNLNIYMDLFLPPYK